MSPQIWSDADKDKMRIAAEWHMIDEGYRQVRTVAIDTVGDDIETFTEASVPTICGLEMHSGTENKGEFTVTTYDATLRIPHDFTISELDRIRITKFRNETVSMVFEVATPKQWGVSGARISLRKIEL